MKLRILLPCLYLAVALLAWVNFWLLPPDGLANVGLMLVVLPATILDLLLRPSDSPGSPVLVPDRFGYYCDHAVFFWISAVAIAAVLWWIGGILDRRRSRSKS